jgi:hypothetical protein
MAKTTADVTLVKGAEAMGKASMPADLSGLDKIIEKGNEMQDEIGGKIEAEQTRRKDLNDALAKQSEEIILNSGSLGKGIFDSTFSKMEGLQDAYATAVQNGNEQERLDILRQVQAHSIFVQDHKATRQDYAKKITDKELSDGMSKSSLHAISKVGGEDYTLGENEKGEQTFNFKGLNNEDVSITQSEYAAMMEPKHYETSTVLAKIFGTIDDGKYNRLDAYNKLTQLTDKLDDRGFKAAIADDVMGQKFSKMLTDDTTLDQELISALGGNWDKDGDGIIDPNEKIDFIDIATNPDNPNFDASVSRKIFREKLLSAADNYADKKAKSDKKEIDDDFTRQKELKQTKSGGTENKVTDSEYTKSLKNKEIKGSLDNLIAEVGNTGWKGSTDLKERAKAAGYGNNDGPFAYVDWYNKNVNSKHKIEWIGGGRDVTNIVGGKDTENPTYQNLQPGFYRMMQDGVDENENPVIVPKLFSKGEKMNWDDIPNGWIDYESKAVENIN